MTPNGTTQRGFGKARVPKKAPPKPLFMPQAVNKSSTHHTATSAINKPNTQRKPRFKLG